jgi:hypothetical protein
VLENRLLLCLLDLKEFEHIAVTCGCERLVKEALFQRERQRQSAH